jgi:hypothetical protein
VYHCKKRDISGRMAVKPSGNRTVAAAGDDIGGRGEKKRCAVHTEKYKKIFKNGRLQPHRKRCPFETPLSPGTFR